MAEDGKRRYLSFETVGSVVAIVVGVAALFVAWDEAKSVRRQQAASVLPVLKISGVNSNEMDGSVTSIVVANIGIGPAFIESASIIWNGEVLDDVEALRAILREDEVPYGIWTSRLDGEIIGGGSSIDLLAISLQRSPQSDEQTYALRRRLYEGLQIEACFCSVYEDCWETSLNKQYRPEPVKECRRPGAA